MACRRQEIAYRARQPASVPRNTVVPFEPFAAQNC